MKFLSVPDKNRQIVRGLLILICWCLLLGVLPASGKDLLSEVEQTPAGLPVLSASVPPFPPFVSEKPSILCQGISRRLLDLIGHQANIHFQFKNYPYARILHSLTAGSLDVALIFKNQSVKDAVQYIGPVARSKVVVLSRYPERLKQYRDLQQLNAIAVIRKAQFEQAFDRDTLLNKISVENYLQGLHMFNAGRVDAVVGSKEGLEYAMLQLNYDTGMLDQAFHLGDKTWWLHVSKKSPAKALVPVLQQAVEALPRSDHIYDLFDSEKNYGCYDRAGNNAGSG